MHENKIFRELLENVYNKEKNYTDISSKIKKVIDMKKKILKIVAVLLIVVIGYTAQDIYAKIAWNISYEKYKNRNVITRSIALDEKAKDKYRENLNMDYIYQDKIGIKLNSLIIANDYCQIDLDIKLDEEIQIGEDNLQYGMVVYDENNNIYNISERWHKNEKQLTYWKKLYKELGIKENQSKELSNTAQYSKSKVTMTSIKGFPKSKKLYIRIFDIGYEDCKIDYEKMEVIYRNDINLSNSEWQFEIDIPEKFYERTETQLKLGKEVEGIDIKKAELTQTGLSMIVNIKQLKDFMLGGMNMGSEEFGTLSKAAFYISDGDDNIYTATEFGTTTENGELSVRFGIGKDDLDKGIFLNVSLNDIQEKIELVQK